MKVVRVSHDARLVQPVAVDARVLCVDVEDAPGELAQRLEVIHVLPDEVRGIEIQAEVGTGNVFIHAAPDFGEMARFLPPGHSSLVNAMGQFSMPMLIPLSAAN